MEHLSLEIFDLTGNGSQYAVLPDDTTITITDTSEIFGSGDVWSHSFTLNTWANAHIFGTAGEIHGSRLHEQIDRRKARLWIEGLPLYLGYLRLDDEASVDEEGNVEVKFEGGSKTFDDLIEGAKAQEVSVGDVEIGIALNRKRVVDPPNITKFNVRLDGLKAYAAKNDELMNLDGCDFEVNAAIGLVSTPYAQQFPKMVKSHGTVYNSSMSPIDYDKTNIMYPYDDTPQHSFCNVNMCYQMKAEDKEGNEVVGRGYTVRLARGEGTTTGGDGETRYNNAPCFYLLYFIDRLFKDMGIHITENQAKNVEDLRRVFMLNYGCHYEEIENSDLDTWGHETPNAKRDRYGQFYLPIIGNLFYNWECAGKKIMLEEDVLGKVLLRDVNVKKFNQSVLTIGSIEGKVTDYTALSDFGLQKTQGEGDNGTYSAYRAYATGENYPNVEIGDIINAMKQMFGIRLLFDGDYKTVRIVLLRNIFRSSEVQEIKCNILENGEKTESSVRGFRMTYGKGEEDTAFYYKGFNDLLPHKKEIWVDTSDKHDYTQFQLNAEYDKIKDCASAMNKVCYVTPVNGNAYAVKVDEDEDVLFPALFEVGGFMDAEDGDCTGEDETIEEVQCGASPVIMNDVNGTYASLFTGDLKAPTRALPGNYSYASDPENPGLGQKIATYSRVATNVQVSMNKMLTEFEFNSWHMEFGDFTVTGKMDVYLSEGFRINMQDNYSISNGGTPFDEADTGLQFGIMRGSGKDAQILYAPDTIENEDPMNDYWEIEPGSGAIDHADTCDNYGELWDYNGEERHNTVTVKTAAQALEQLQTLFPNSNAPFNNSAGYITAAYCKPIKDNLGMTRMVLFVVKRSDSDAVFYDQGYTLGWDGASAAQWRSNDSESLIVEVDSSPERGDTLVQLCEKAYVNDAPDVVIDNGVGTRNGRFSLKLRAEKPNPDFDPTQPESNSNRRYLTITNKDLQRRGLIDQFYKEYSLWVRNARTTTIPTDMTIAQLMAIDKTVRARIGDITGFIKKTQYSVNNQTGLGTVMLEVMYL